MFDLQAANIGKGAEDGDKNLPKIALSFLKSTSKV